MDTTAKYVSCTCVLRIYTVVTQAVNYSLLHALQLPPYLWERDTLENGTLALGNDRYYGYCADLMAELAKDLKLKDYILTPVRDGEYGNLLKNGTWTGMVGELTDGVSLVLIWRHVVGVPLRKLRIWRSIRFPIQLLWTYTITLLMAIRFALNVVI